MKAKKLNKEIRKMKAMHSGCNGITRNLYQIIADV